MRPDLSVRQGYSMTPFQIFIIRVIVGAGMAVLLVRIFYGKVQIVYAIGLAVFMVGMAYVMEYFRKKRENKP
jgi:peptidoglycan biosynthesis protein MviN/MurJ (putative lipid II flippase)